MSQKKYDYKFLVCVLFILGYLSYLPLANAKGCTGFCANKNTFLTESDVRSIIVQAVKESEIAGVFSTIAVTDRVGNVLAVYRMNGNFPNDTTFPRIKIDAGRGVLTGLDGVSGVIPSSLAAIAKAITGAYLSSEGNAFSTRTASHIIMQNFNPLETDQPAGPLFGVQFSSLPCSDLVTRFTGQGADVGPKRSPLGLSADPGGFPLYKNGTVVGGIGVETDLIYGADLNIRDRDNSIDEHIALAGTLGFVAPEKHRADRITVEGKTLRYSDFKYKKIRTNSVSGLADLSSIASAGQLIQVPVYFDGQVLAGTAFGEANSGIRPASNDFSGLDAFVLVDNQNQERFPAIAGALISRDESLALLQSAIAVANRARAQIRKPFNSQARVTVSLVDTKGDVLGVVRTRDAPVFGTDVSLQKARTAAFFSNAIARDKLNAATDAIYASAGIGFPISDYVDAAIDLFNDPNVLTGAFAFTDRAGGNLSRPFFPDGIQKANNGPFSKPFPEWSPFSTGLQLDLVVNGMLTHVAAFYGAAPDIGMDCTASPAATLNVINNFLGIQNFNVGQAIPELRNGIQIFPGSVPVYRGNTLIGGLGVSGDGIDQDDLISFLGVHNAGKLTNTVNNAPPDIRADNLTPAGVRLRYVQCPYKPFLDSGKQNACSGK